ncbi:hypothetical protein [Nocardia wallacei]|uniref:hypothetical protein n=1 Tax=Nocardia wallacei TaxID=480035 RepID=UPI0024585C76|nr:hypothetical protein [Nocardia wallacei]
MAAERPRRAESQPPRNLSFPRYYLLFDAEGNLTEPDGPAEAATAMLDQLRWWASALAAARVAA